MVRFTLVMRSSGVLLHPTSLPGPHGIGDLGPEAFRFVDFLHSSGQTWWQTFPLGPAGYGGSPYQPTSAFAGNPLLISLDALVSDGLLKERDIRRTSFSADEVQFDKVSEFKQHLFQKAFWAFESKSKEKSAFQAFLKRNKLWLEDYALYCVLKEIYKGAPWIEWSSELRDRNPQTLARVKKQLASAMRYHQFLQYEFAKQWAALKSYAHQKSVGFIGDIPIFVAHDSADVWANPNLFYLKSDGQPLYVAGTPPDYFSRDGQRWGNPLYRWDVMKKTGYQWWLDRFRFLYHWVDAIRLDHFIGFERYWRIPGGSSTAKNGKWVPGPSDHFFQVLVRKLPHLEIIAEDLGVVTEAVKALRDRFKFPGMKILQFAFGDLSPNNHFLPHNYMRNTVVYTGTHDNDTTVGWYRDQGGKTSTRDKDQISKERQYALKYMQSNGREIHWDMIRLAQSSVANIAMTPVQDLLGLSSKARMNVPGTSRGNWAWRLKKGQLTTQIARRLCELSKRYGR